MKSPVHQQHRLPRISVSMTLFQKMFPQYQVLTVFLLLFTSTVFSQNFEVYISDAGSFNIPPWKILKFDENGQNPEVFIDDNLGWPQDILFLEDQGVVLISNLNTNRINKHDDETGEFIEVFANGISGPTRMKIGEDNLIYVLQWSGNGRVRRYEQDGTYVGEFTSVTVSQSIGMDWDATGNLYVSSYNGASVRKFDQDGNDLGLFINSNLLGPTNIWFDDNGDLLVVDYNGTGVKRFDSDGNFIENFLTGLGNAEGVAYLPNGNILVGNGANSSVKMFDPDGNYLSDFITSSAGNLMTPNAVIIRDLGTVGTSSPNELEEVIVYPTVGSIFYLQAEYAQDIEEVNIYSTDGRHVSRIDNPAATPFIWRAVNYPSGVYVLQLSMRNGDRYTNKIIVQ